MGVETQSAPVERRQEWARMRNLVSGARAARREVSQLPGHDRDTFNQYRERAYFLPGLARTIEAFGGLLFLNEPEVDAGDTFAPYLADITLDGMSARRLAEAVTAEILGPGRCAVLVDHPKTPTNPDGSPISRADAEANGVRAFARMYLSEDILGYEFAYLGGVRVLTRVRLRETVEEAGEDEFTVATRPAVRVCELFGGTYRQRLFVKEKSTGKYTLRETIVPLQNGAPMVRIPIVFFSDRDHSPEPRRPALADLADVNVSHLDTSAMLEWGLMWTANPTPCFKNITPVYEDDDEGRPRVARPTIRLGSSEGLMFGADGDAWFLEFEGSGLSAVKDSLEAKRRDMANLGARILMDDPRAQVAAETARIQNAGQNSVLAGIANVVSEGMTQVLQMMDTWAATAADPSMTVNSDFNAETLTAEQIKAALALVMAGEMSSSELFALLQRGGMIDRQKPEDLHREEIEGDGSRIAASDVRGLPRPRAVTA